MKQQTQIVRNYVTITEKVPISYFMKIYDQQLPKQSMMKKRSQCQTLSAIYHYNELDYTDRIYYVLKTSEIFPYDVEIGERYNKTPLPKSI